MGDIDLLHFISLSYNTIYQHSIFEICQSKHTVSLFFVNYCSLGLPINWLKSYLSLAQPMPKTLSGVSLFLRVEG